MAGAEVQRNELIKNKQPVFYSSSDCANLHRSSSLSSWNRMHGRRWIFRALKVFFYTIIKFFSKCKLKKMSLSPCALFKKFLRKQHLSYFNQIFYVSRKDLPIH
ncbi:unnamed protein product [Cylicocyclus nassatus]|uniref:Uncharacterized protein n=1 Tax=Cylicocyclus nassatus TaxID=53992 RepID=A0AA36GVZ4_CYLNA|nr:unnamed protein product [Cylicocyclus nassatus]